MNKILIACKTGWQFPNRRQRCLNTWMLSVPLYPGGLDAVLHFGVEDAVAAERQGNCLFLPAPNGRNYLPQRMRLLCAWAIKQEWWDYLWCMDDDTRLSVPRLIKYETKDADYIGPEWRLDAGYASGGGNFLSRRAAEIVACELTETIGPDDLLIGALLKRHGIKQVVDNERFRVLMPTNAEPGPDNNWVYTTPRERE